MPTKRTRVQRRPGGSGSLRKLDPEELIAFCCVWRPPIGEFELSRAQWKTWAEYLTDYESQREQLRENRWIPGQPVFAERHYHEWSKAGQPADWAGPDEDPDEDWAA